MITLINVTNSIFICFNIDYTPDSPPGYCSDSHTHHTPLLAGSPRVSGGGGGPASPWGGHREAGILAMRSRN